MEEIEIIKGVSLNKHIGVLDECAGLNSQDIFKLEFPDKWNNDIITVEVNPDIKPSEYSYILKLMITSTYTREEQSELWADLEDKVYTAQELINTLLMNQLDPIEAGLNYSQSDIQKKLDLIDNDNRK